MRTIVLSDLHLGSARAGDLLRRADLRAPLLRRVEPGDRVVLLGDVVEFRQGAAAAALAVATPFLRELGERIGARGELVVLAGNHDHALVSPWLERRLETGARLELEHRMTPSEAGPLAEGVARAAGPAPVSLAYPGIRLRDDVYATHGHYLDRHITVPTFERLAAGAVGRFFAPMSAHGPVTPDEYETVLAPLYAFLHALAQRATPARAASPAGSSVGVWQALTRGRRRSPRVLALAAAYELGVIGVNRLGIGPVRRQLSGDELRRAGLLAMRATVERLGITAPHVIFGHTHRSGPHPGDDRAEWGPLHNTGSWVFQRHFLTRTPGESPYWPGTVVVLEDGAPPRLERLLGYRNLDDLAPAPAQATPGVKRVA